jgi:hypothetical protein
MKKINKVLLIVFLISLSANIYLLLSKSSTLQPRVISPLFGTPRPAWADSLLNKTLKIGFRQVGDVGSVRITIVGINEEKNTKGEDGILISYVWQPVSWEAADCGFLGLSCAVVDAEGFADRFHGSVEARIKEGEKTRGKLFLKRTFSQVQELSFFVCGECGSEDMRGVIGSYSAEYPCRVVILGK